MRALRAIEPFGHRMAFTTRAITAGRRSSARFTWQTRGDCRYWRRTGLSDKREGSTSIEGGPVDPASLSTLAGAVGSGLVSAMTTDAWQTIRSHVAQTIARGSRHSEQDIVKQLDESQARIQVGNATNDRLLIMRSEADTWTHRLNGVLTDNSGLASEFELILRLMRQLSAESTANVIQRTVAGHDAYTAGADQYINIHLESDDGR
jgi:hypothetical protein